MADTRPIIALALGDIAGVGPEIVAKALGNEEVRQVARVAVFGPAKPVARLLGETFPDMKSARVSEAAMLRDWDFDTAVPVVDDLVIQAPCYREVMGKIDAQAGRSSHAAVIAAADACLAHHAEAMTTAPIHKAAWKAAGVPHPGHTEVLAERTDAKQVVMMLASPQLKVTLATIHVRLADVPKAITPERLAMVIDVTAKSMRLFGVAKPRVAVAGLNPHAGDEGMFGDEEIKVIAPAIEAARQRGFDVCGPFPADTVFAQAKSGDYDAVVAMYHDQGLAAIKTLDFDNAVNISLGLPIIRTSVDHGTAFDIAGKGIANPSSLIHALKLAAKMAVEKRSATQAGA